MGGERSSADVRNAVRQFYAGGDPENWEMTDTPRVHTDEELRTIRSRDNVDRPNRVNGAEYHVLLNTCAVLAVERDEARAEADRHWGSFLAADAERQAHRAYAEGLRAELAAMRGELTALAAAWQSNANAVGDATGERIVWHQCSRALDAIREATDATD